MNKIYDSVTAGLSFAHASASTCQQVWHEGLERRKGCQHTAGFQCRCARHKPPSTVSEASKVVYADNAAADLKNA